MAFDWILLYQEEVVVDWMPKKCPSPLAAENVGLEQNRTVLTE